MTQMTAKAGVKKHGKAAVTALIEEFFPVRRQNSVERGEPGHTVKETEEDGLKGYQPDQGKTMWKTKRENCSRR